MKDALPLYSSAEDYHQAGLAALENWSVRQDSPCFSKLLN